MALIWKCDTLTERSVPTSIRITLPISMCWYNTAVVNTNRVSNITRDIHTISSLLLLGILTVILCLLAYIYIYMYTSDQHYVIFISTAINEATKTNYKIYNVAYTFIYIYILLNYSTYFLKLTLIKIIQCREFYGFVGCQVDIFYVRLWLKTNFQSICLMFLVHAT